MFARTPRLLLRPGWAEDAAALTRAIADEAVVRNLSTTPWPYSIADAEAHLTAPQDPVLPSFLISARTAAAPLLIGACWLTRHASGRVELGTWIARAHWGRGFATEAGRALIDIAATLGLAELDAAHFLDSPASGRVLEKLGFTATGLTAPRHSCARGGEAIVRLMKLSLAARALTDQPLAA